MHVSPATFRPHDPKLDHSLGRASGQNAFDIFSHSYDRPEEGMIFVPHTQLREPMSAGSNIGTMQVAAADVIELAREYGRYGYRRIAVLLRRAGWRVNQKWVARIWRREGLKVPHRQKKRGRLWLGDGPCVRLKSEHANHVWSYDFVQDRTGDGRAYRTLNILDEFPREASMICVDRRLNSTDVVDALTDLFIQRGPPRFIRSDNGPEFVAQKVRDWIEPVGARTADIEPGSPWESGYCESFNARSLDELLNGEVFYSLWEAQILIERWRKH